MVKQSFFFMALTAMLLVSCSVSKSARSQRNLFSGSWTLNNISYENNTGNFKSVIFNDAEDICFEGSDWFFRDNNSTGRYTISSSSLCQGGDRFFRWSVVEPTQNYSSQLQFKFIDEKRKDISGGVGYRLNITDLTEQSMTLKSNVSVDGQPVTIVYEFSKR
ncbi:lipocalin family protein [Flagellimonas pacifica]|uniref:Lipocalin-like domain-containing protein n=1 Tax=Flagellimonas pacifica TaxID=1247520 RepID=A0A285MS40_9FLAO|nr:lipocalin family protein [Allomuricauda parva]SNZ00004.1 Lipocalin-like domain-containing protein [Allomuricauda parva]